MDMGLWACTCTHEHVHGHGPVPMDIDPSGWVHERHLHLLNFFFEVEIENKQLRTKVQALENFKIENETMRAKTEQVERAETEFLAKNDVTNDNFQLLEHWMFTPTPFCSILSFT